MENSEPIADEEDRAVHALRREVMMLLLWAPSLEDLLGDSIQEICDQVDQKSRSCHGRQFTSPTPSAGCLQSSRIRKRS